MQTKFSRLSARDVDQYVADLDYRLNIIVVWNIRKDFLAVRPEGGLKGFHGLE